MLNGKFYTGLPPKMSERSSGVGINRQESHLFWPDDTKTESAVEIRVRRRTSLLLNDAEPRPCVVRRSESRPEQEVNTRSLFKKEFVNSSIQFYDNLQDETTSKLTPTRRRLLAKRQELTPKLTATKMELPKQQAGSDEAFTAENRKQAYTSKIEFNDFVNEPPSTRNNVRKPRLDMNDKREVERNTKNSPKLQVKRNVRNLSLERELVPREKTLNSTARPQSMAIDVSAAPPTPSPHKPVNLDNSFKEPPAYRALVGDARRTAPPKKILKHVSAAPPCDDYANDYGHELQHDDYLENGFSELRIRGTPTHKKHVTYSDEAYDRPPYGYYDRQRMRTPPPPLRQIRTYYPAREDYDHGDAADGGPYLDEDEAHNQSYGNSRSHSHSHSQSLGRRVMPNMRTGNHGNQRQQQRTERQYMETSSDSAKMLNNNKNNYNSNISNHNNNYRNSNKLNSKMVNNNRESAVDSSTAAASSASSTMLAHESESAQCSEHDSSSTAAAAADPRKHLRSSLCFSGDALMVDPTSEAAAASSADTPTSAARRNARSSATKRVSVGLPD